MSAETLTLRVPDPSDRAILEQAAARRRMALEGLLTEGLVLRAELEVMARAGGQPSEARAEALTARMRAQEGRAAFDGPSLTLTIAAPEDRADIARAALQTGRAPDDWAAEVLAACLIPFERADLSAWARAGRPAPHPHWRASERLSRIVEGLDPDPETGGAPSLLETELWAASLFREVQDKAGAPYFGHLERVAAHLVRLFPRAEEGARHAAWLHDAMEDAAVRAPDLRARGYDSGIVEIVALVTRVEGEPYAAWIDRIAACRRIDAIRVKIADLSDNADPARLAQLPEGDRARLRDKYSGALERLCTVAAKTGPLPFDFDPRPMLDGMRAAFSPKPPRDGGAPGSRAALDALLAAAAPALALAGRYAPQKAERLYETAAACLHAGGWAQIAPEEAAAGLAPLKLARGLCGLGAGGALKPGDPPFVPRELQEARAPYTPEGRALLDLEAYARLLETFVIHPEAQILAEIEDGRRRRSHWRHPAGAVAELAAQRNAGATLQAALGPAFLAELPRAAAAPAMARTAMLGRVAGRVQTLARRPGAAVDEQGRLPVGWRLEAGLRARAGHRRERDVEHARLLAQALDPGIAAACRGIGRVLPAALFDLAAANGGA